MIALVLLALVAAFAIFMLQRGAEPRGTWVRPAHETVRRAGPLAWWWYDETWSPHGPYYTERAARADLMAYARYLDGNST